ncbi:hypothetical protein ACP70R_019430 [Stipagrostis hirtigluma subsp. patula]
MEQKRHETTAEPSAEEAAAAAAVASVLGDDDLLAEILLRLGSPAWLVRAALVSTRWLRRASDPAVLRRFRALHPPRILALRLAAIWPLPIPQPRELTAAAGRVLQILTLSKVCDCRNGRLLIEVDGRERWEYPAYAIRSLLRPARDNPLPPPPHSISGNLLPAGQGNGHCRLLLLLGDDVADTSCLCLDLTHNGVQICVEFSVLESGAWGAQHCPVTELRQGLMDTFRAQRLLVGRKLYMMTTHGNILGLDLATASFFTVQLPDEARTSKTLKLSRGQHSGLYLIDAIGFQLRIWHGDGAGQWVLVDAISVREACGHLNVRKWEPDDGHTAPLSVVVVGDNAEFVILELVATGIVCCMQVGNRVVEKVAEGVLQNYDGLIRPITMVWPPIFPVLDKASQE